MGFLNGGHDCLDNCRRFLKDLIVPKTQDAKARCRQLPIAFGIVGCGFGMLPTVQFDNKSCFERNEIEHEAIEWMLPPKFDAKLPATQVLPEQAFCIGGAIPELLRNPVLSQPVVTLSVHS